MAEYKVDWECLPWVYPAPGVRHKIFSQDGRRLRLVEFSEGFTEPDWCTRGHIGYVLEGELEVDFQGVLVHYSPNDGVFIPTGPEHGHKATVLSKAATLVLVEEG